MDAEAKRDRIVSEIRRLAGELGAISDELENVADAENYDYQVRIGLAETVAEIFEGNPYDTIHWLGYCLIACGIEPDARISCLLDSLVREVDAQIEEEDEDEES